jgi:hypothetical protein
VNWFQEDEGWSYGGERESSRVELEHGLNSNCNWNATGKEKGRATGLSGNCLAETNMAANKSKRNKNKSQE